ncbi:hypothetical protein LPB72_07110 [Hydrogenophaga crassostreae]|uniref:DUF4123 domain-containing protein n=1 Tax=Hydrogenophaga crassostreae TaxID=1763535 RepID=A0A167IFT3_9BURK|nr:hypothetical protein [Hydrogenophaga crassostreae]AOW13182.1 hypothetical protein LPB072_10265 [Hydrogenophaga crassostreae]OAD42672.1 hypothetical protein LPB72_07110 [Hydrogenophaga crassostreae]
MLKQRIYVNVVGFSDVERHALNTVFRLSAERDVRYAPWVPSDAKGDTPVLMNAEVALVDGDSAEAVLSQAKALPIGQRLIWVGSDPPDHAWRVWQRPMRWAEVLHDLDAVFAARQADSGFLDFDVTSPQPLFLDSGEQVPDLPRALLVGAKGSDLLALRTSLNAVGVNEFDETDVTDFAAELIGRNKYCCGVFNLDEAHLDAWALSRLFADRHPQAMTLGITHQAGPLAAWWKKRLMRHETQKTGVNALLGLPLQAGELAQCMERLR